MHSTRYSSSDAPVDRRCNLPAAWPRPPPGSSSCTGSTAALAGPPGGFPRFLYPLSPLSASAQQLHCTSHVVQDRFAELNLRFLESFLNLRFPETPKSVPQRVLGAYKHWLASVATNSASIGQYQRRALRPSLRATASTIQNCAAHRLVVHREPHPLRRLGAERARTSPASLMRRVPGKAQAEAPGPF